ncbi:chloride conductance regulatory protein ICln-like isoform X2 [Durio zibethinus]|uniref:Chloride conductance regulatory protein ICln-like isoform X2 n=1 Tax=Durio zibethinus TaxID=66656 RepID=A0A6P6ALP3_DURZI|nr:chloride conductance regulatory protein ICln-like isoform X2 [Durio zibethinus]
MVVGLWQFTARASNGAGEPVLDPDNGEELVHVQASVSIALGNRAPEYPGTLYITTKQVIWLSDVDRAKGYAVDFLSLSLHAVSRDPEAYHSPCIYTQIETEADEDESEDLDSECNEVLDLTKVTEMRLIPSDVSHLDTLFQIFCECAELNPEPIEEGDGPEWHFPQNLTNSIGHSNGDDDLAHTVLELQINDQRFDDAEEMEQASDRSHHHQ